MNFLGHARAALWVDRDPQFVLGAMAPDFARMAGLRHVRSAHPRLAAGIAWHHRTDAAFHDCGEFAALCIEARAALHRANLPRGAVLAASHVGLELLLDGELGDDDELLHGYREALSSAHDLDAAIDDVIVRLAGHGAPRWYRDVDALVHRLVRILGAHPRLALGEHHHAALHAWLHDAQARVRARRDALLGQLRERLAVG